MNKVYKLVMALFVGVVMLGVAAYAQEPEMEGQAIEPQDSVTDEAALQYSPYPVKRRPCRR